MDTKPSPPCDHDLGKSSGLRPLDGCGRQLSYLRFSLTEACNMACTYCLPQGYPEWLRHKASLDIGAISTILEGFRLLGFRKVRFTGGEPTLHKDCLEAVRIAAALGFEAIALTTNGVLIKDLNTWTRSGLTHLNVSLDSLDPMEFNQITKSKSHRRVIGLIENALVSGLTTKVNTVLMRSVNGSPETIGNLLDWAMVRPITLRFIELMETGLNRGFASQERVLGTALEPLILARGFYRPRTVPENRSISGPALEYHHDTMPGKIGLINPMSNNFCSNCNRLRVTARGQLKLCLFGENDSSLNLSSPTAVALNVLQLIGKKPDRHYLDVGNFGNVATFRTIGG